MECLQQLLEALEPVVVAAAGDFSQSYEGFSTDTRTVKAGNVFVALSGERFDGHDFVVGAAEAGAVCAIVERKVDAAITQIVVTDSGLAFGLAAKAWRGRFALPLAVVAGSNGKTTTTQMLASILLVRWGAERMCATEGNFNNEVGVPKMLLKLAFEHRGAVIECGMNHRGEMARLADWTRPTVALLTNAQREHQEFLRGVEETARENGLVIAALPESGTAVYPADDACADIWADLALARGVDELTYSTDPDVEADVMGRVENGELVISTDEGDVVRTKLRITGSHNVHNATGAAAAAFAMGIGPEAVAAGFGAFEPVPGRGTRFVGKHLVVIDEAYNANPDSVRAAMNVLAGEAGPRTFILGDMGEIGDSAEEAHREAGEYARSLGIDALYACGPLSRHAAEAFGEGGRWFETRDALIEALKGLRGTATVKASHFMGFAAVVRALQDNEE